MPVQWTAEQDQRLLLLILSIHKVDNAMVATAWKSKYGEDVTASAIRQHLNKLKKEVGGDVGSDGQTHKATPKATPKKTNATAMKSALPKTPTSGKRKARSMSDEDDSEDEKAMDLNSPSKSAGPRAKSQRRSKTPKTYRELDDDDAADDEGDTAFNDANGYDGIFDQHMKLEGAAGNGDGGNFDGMSDISSFEPGA